MTAKADAMLSRRLNWKPRTPDGDQVADIVEILHELGLPDEELRRVAVRYVENRFPQVNCTISRANLDEFLSDTHIIQTQKADDGDDRAGF